MRAFPLVFPQSKTAGTNSEPVQYLIDMGSGSATMSSMTMQTTLADNMGQIVFFGPLKKKL